MVVSVVQIRGMIMFMTQNFVSINMNVRRFFGQTLMLMKMMIVGVAHLPEVEPVETDCDTLSLHKSKPRIKQRFRR